MSPALRSLLFDIRQHAAFEELKKAVERPSLPRFKASEKLSLDEFGAKAAFESGRLNQHENWLTLLTGTPLTGDQ